MVDLARHLDPRAHGAGGARAAGRVLSLHPAAQAFASAADAYERGRPEYAPDALAWLARRVGLRPGRIALDLGAGTGKLTRGLAATGAEVVAVEPLDELRARLEASVPGVRALAGTAEAIPLPDGAADAVAAGQAFHWFDPQPALREIHRVLVLGGAVALLWNVRDGDDPLQAAIDAEVRPLRERAPESSGVDVHDEIARSGLFGPVDERRFAHAHRLSREGVLDRVASTSVVAALPPAERRALLERVRALVGGEEAVLRYVTEVYVADRLDFKVS